MSVAKSIASSIAKQVAQLVALADGGGGGASYMNGTVAADDETPLETMDFTITWTDTGYPTGTYAANDTTPTELDAVTFTFTPATKTYQWKLDGVNISGATSNPLVVTNANPTDDDGDYTVVVTDPVTGEVNEYGPVTIAVTALDADAVDYIERAEALGGDFDRTAINAAYTEVAVKTAISDFVAGLKSDGIWTKLHEAYLLSGVSFTGLRAKLKHAGTASLTNNNFVSGDYVAAGSGAGLKNGSTKYLETSYSVLSPTKSNFSMGGYCTEVGSLVAATGLIAASYTATGDTDRLYLGTDGGPTGIRAAIGNKSAFFASTAAGMFSVQTGSTTSFAYYKNGTLDASASDWNNNGFQTGTFRVGRGYSATGGNFRQIFCWVGQALTAGENANLYTRTTALKTALGA